MLVADYARADAITGHATSADKNRLQFASEHDGQIGDFASIRAALRERGTTRGMEHSASVLLKPPMFVRANQGHRLGILDECRLGVRITREDLPKLHVLVHGTHWDKVGDILRDGIVPKVSLCPG